MSEFEFAFEGPSRDELLAEASKMVRGGPGELGEGEGGGADDPEAAITARLLEQLNGDVAEFSSYPDVVRLDREHFVERNLPVPAQFDALTERNTFYWLRFPVTLSTRAELPFTKLECAVELNPDEQLPHRRPRAHAILPDKKFESKLAVDGNVDVRIGEDLQFEAGVPAMAVATPVGHASVKASANASAKASAGISGTFSYKLKKARLTHSGTGTEKVFWRFDDAEFVTEDDPTFIVVMQLPHGVEEVQIAAVMQAYHGFSLAEAGLARTIQYYTSRLAKFFRAGAPVRDPKVWDITPSL